VKTGKHFAIKANVSSRASASEHLKQPGDAVVVDRQGPRWLIIQCPCGCGAELPINLDRRAGPAWRLYASQKYGVSVYPSVWRDTDCKSHFIIWRNKILMMGVQDDRFWDEDTAGSRDELDKLVLSRLSRDRQQSAEQISDQLPGSVPWDVLLSCRRLGWRGLAEEGQGNAIGHFKLR
jgi:uncharacterized protein DUF6527